MGAVCPYSPSSGIDFCDFPPEGLTEAEEFGILVFVIENGMRRWRNGIRASLRC